MPNSTDEKSEYSPSLIKRENWFKLVEEYSRRNLTHEKDKVPAILGLAQAMTAEYDTYCAGLFTSQIPSSLLWRTTIEFLDEGTVLRRPFQYSAPSCSWAAVEGPVSFDSQRLFNIGEGLNYEHSPDDFGDFTLLQVFTNTPEAESLTPDRKSFIQLRGRFISCQAAPSPLFEGDRTDTIFTAMDRKEQRIGLVHPDIPTELKPYQGFFCLEIRKEHYASKDIMPYELFGRNIELEDEESSRAMVMGLALVKDDERIGACKRIGLCRWMIRSCFANAEIVDIKIY
ncbi:uncharacterized protein KY384_000812 [Bacidia gigantensis]|uniref:uncharacterized protein n=1 Tax=Bacidia gigantensis TaxID=2732470 RepID=UPI001D037549|nr:uncharacterized protein KY384_000812 [Bacidia gigantensis]KAG8526050.1 hypothetical protein KY384_000812 [Bacidia gigantensis]